MRAGTNRWDSENGPERSQGSGGLVPVSSYLPTQQNPYGYGPIGTYDFEGKDQGPNLAATVMELWRVLTKHKWLILGLILSSVLLGTVWTLMKKPLYTSTVRLQIERNTVKVVETGNVTPIEGQDTEFLKTQYELLQSRSLAERVVSALNLDEDSDFFAPTSYSLLETLQSFIPLDFQTAGSPQNTITPKTSKKRSAVGIVMGNREVRPVPGSRLVNINYTDPNPLRAQRIAEAYGQAFITSAVDKRFEANAFAKTFLEDQVKQLKLRLEDSEKNMLEFAQREQIVVATERTSIAENNLASANATLGNLVSERIKNEQLWKQAENADAVNLPQFLSNSVINTLRGTRKELTTEYQEKLETYKPNYPVMVQIKLKIDEIDRQLTAEIKTIKDSLKAAFESSLQQETEMKGRIDNLRAEFLDLQKRSIQYNILKREVDTNRSLYDSLLKRIKEVDVAGGAGSNNIFIVDRAEVPGSPSSPNLSRALLLSFVMGFGFSMAGAYLIEKMDTTIYAADKVEEITGLPMLGIIPRCGDIIELELDDPRSGLSEAYRSLCTALQFSSEKGLPKSLLITSSGPSEGKSLTSMSVAKIFATLGLKVLLIDGDLRKASLHHKLGHENDIGLTNYLTGQCTPPETFQKTSNPNLAFMASGPLPVNAADLISSPKFLSLITRGTEIFDLIVIDGPPVLGLADAPLLASLTEATLFVVAAGHTKTSMLRGAIKRLQMTRAPIVGTLLTKFHAPSAGYGYEYGYGYGQYGYGYGRGGGHSPSTISPQDQAQLAATHETS